YDDESKQAAAGGPLQHDQTGVEIYNTVFSLTPSPHEDATIWAGTDDGRVWITRNDGGDWTEVTPEGLPRWSTVNTIEVSPHRAGKAYLAVYRYRLDDFEPYIYRTTDYGQSWTRIADGTRGIPEEHPTRVVREDPDREGLLYAGTEYGMYVSFDDGAHWQSLQLNLPVTPVTDLRVHRKDLVVGTQGRSFWILDDLAPLHQIDDRVATSEAHLFSPRAAYRIEAAGFRGSPWPEVGPRGALIDYWLGESPEGTVRIEVLEEDGDLVRRFTSDSSAVEAAREDQGVGRLMTEPLPTSRGTHRVAWDLRYPGPDLTEDAVLWADIGGVKAVPGSYRLRMIVGSDTVGTRTLELRKDPRNEDVTREDLEAQFELATTIRDTLDRLYGSLRTLRSVREQVEGVADRAEKAVTSETRREEIRALADSIVAELSAVEDTLIQTKHESGQDVINYPARLDDRLAALGEVAGVAVLSTTGWRRGTTHASASTRCSRRSYPPSTGWPERRASRPCWRAAADASRPAQRRGESLPRPGRDGGPAVGLRHRRVPAG
ncbi:MAG: WD40/YVTN/BNR-like repeat-containing protein, partial [Gemmatimonadota bacterium]